MNPNDTVYQFNKELPNKGLNPGDIYNNNYQNNPNFNNLANSSLDKSNLQLDYRFSKPTQDNNE